MNYRASEEKNIRLKFDKEVILIKDKGTNLRMGARPLRRSLQRNLEANGGCCLSETMYQLTVI